MCHVLRLFFFYSTDNLPPGITGDKTLSASVGETVVLNFEATDPDSESAQINVGCFLFHPDQLKNKISIR